MKKKLVFIALGVAFLSTAYANTKVNESDSHILNGYTIFYDETTMTLHLV